ncbi:hypothetical protein RUM43_013972 [Polyplax serrata]|uniref:Uncharacterized protein n=1 Tax=Polyplax serrata TaxID=468196 RepID=A0AAN8RYV8_POLSC
MEFLAYPGFWLIRKCKRSREHDAMFVVPKRAALILDRILKEIESAKESNQLINDWSPISRRGNNKDKLYFRCYFNAVSCYKRK